MVGRISLVGYDGETMHFDAQSGSRSGLVHTITLDRHKMLVTCSCEAGTLLKRKWWLLGPDDQELCVHVRSLRRFILPRLKEAGVL